MTMLLFFASQMLIVQLQNSIITLSSSEFIIVNRTSFLLSFSKVSSLLNLEKKILWFLGLYKSNLIDLGLDLKLKQ